MTAANGEQERFDGRDQSVTDPMDDGLDRALGATRAASLALLDKLSVSTGKDVIDEALQIKETYAEVFGGAKEFTSKTLDGEVTATERAGSGPDHIDELTNRENEILAATAEGLSNVQIAARFWITEQTIKFHLSNIYSKLGVRNRTEASAVWHRRSMDHSGERGQSGFVANDSAPAEAVALSPALPDALGAVARQSEQLDPVRSMRLAGALLRAATQFLEVAQMGDAGETAPVPVESQIVDTNNSDLT
ncbi:MAG TPA: response regulator transcription factor [Candidatus Saccharimonadales bacterium]|nr:response regulator transcription factor [Candidatus Saccharimonadales bacterium]